MSFKFRNKIIDLSNEELIQLLKNNNYHFEEILAKQGINGEQFLELREIDFVRWKVTLSEKKQIWHCVTEMKNNPETFFSKPLIPKMTIEATFKNADQKAKISVRPQNLSYNKPKLPPKSSPVLSVQPPEYLAMDKTSPEGLYDEESYLLPTERTEEIEENYYEQDLDSTILAGPKPITTNDRNYLLEEIEDTYEEVEEKNSFSEKLTKLFSNFKTNENKKMVRKGLQSRPLPELPQEIYINQYEDESSSSGEGIFVKDGKTLGKILELAPSRMYKMGSASSLASQKSAGSNETLHKLPLPPDTLPKAPLLLPKNFFQLEAQSDSLHNDNNHPYFRNTDRKGAKHLLHDLPDGAFLLRKSDNYYRAITLKYDEKFINLGIEKLSNGMLRLCEKHMKSLPDFAGLDDLVDYFTENPIGFELTPGEACQTVLKKILPSSRF